MQKPWLLVPFLVGIFSGAMAFAESPLDKIKTFLEDTKPATLADIPENTSWAGRCVSTGSPRRIFGIMINFYHVKDTVLEDFVYAVAVKHANRDRYYTITGAEAQKVRDEVDKNQLEYYSELAPEGDALKTSCDIPDGKSYLKEDEAYPTGKTFAQAMEIRVKKDANQPPMFALKISCNMNYSCPGMGYGAAEENVTKGDVGVYCYFDKKILPLPPPPVVKPVDPKPIITPVKPPEPPIKKPVSTQPNPEPVDPGTEGTKVPVKDDGVLD